MSRATRRMELPIADALGRVGPTMNVTLGDRQFRDVPINWQDWTLWQHVAVEEHYGSVGRFQRMWLGLSDEPDEDADPKTVAADLMAKAQRINEGESAVKRTNAKEAATPLDYLGMPDCPVSTEDQAFYAWVLLAPWEATEAEHVLSDEDRQRGPDAWTISLDWVLANATQMTLKLILMNVILAQYQATAGELEGEAEAGKQQKGVSSSPESGGDDSSDGCSGSMA